MANILSFDCYKYNRHWLLIEMMIDDYSDKLDLNAFTVPEDNVSEYNWQVPYLEHYLNTDGTQRACDLYDVPKQPLKPCRIAFFIYKTGGKVLRTPYGECSIEQLNKMPKRLKRIVKFEKPD